MTLFFCVQRLLPGKIDSKVVGQERLDDAGRVDWRLPGASREERAIRIGPGCRFGRMCAVRASGAGPLGFVVIVVVSGRGS